MERRSCTTPEMNSTAASPSISNSSAARAPSSAVSRLSSHGAIASASHIEMEESDGSRSAPPGSEGSESHVPHAPRKWRPRKEPTRKITYDRVSAATAMRTLSARLVRL